MAKNKFRNCDGTDVTSTAKLLLVMYGTCGSDVTRIYFITWCHPSSLVRLPFVLPFRLGFLASFSFSASFASLSSISSYPVDSACPLPFIGLCHNKSKNRTLFYSILRMRGVAVEQHISFGSFWNQVITCEDLVCGYGRTKLNETRSLKAWKLHCASKEILEQLLAPTRSSFIISSSCLYVYALRMQTSLRWCCSVDCCLPKLLCLQPKC